MLPEISNPEEISVELVRNITKRTPIPGEMRLNGKIKEFNAQILDIAGRGGYSTSYVFNENKENLARIQDYYKSRGFVSVLTADVLIVSWLSE